MRTYTLLLVSVFLLMAGNLQASDEAKPSPSVIILSNINVIDVIELKVIENQSVVIVDEKIDFVGSRVNKRAYKNAITIDMSGKFLIPGLIDGHVHHATDPDGWDKQSIAYKRLQVLLRGGVTGVRDMGGDARALAYMKRQAEVDAIQSPDVYFSVIIGGEEFFL